jgi:hypothetical protein
MTTALELPDSFERLLLSLTCLASEKDRPFGDPLGFPATASSKVLHARHEEKAQSKIIDITGRS